MVVWMEGRKRDAAGGVPAAGDDQSPFLPPLHPQVKAAMDAATAAFGPIDIMMANAGICPTGEWGEGKERGEDEKTREPRTCFHPPPHHPPGMLLDSPPSHWTSVMAVNYGGAVNAAAAAAPAMAARGAGALVFVSSSAGLVGAAGISAYVASKHAVVGLADSLQLEVKREGGGVEWRCVRVCVSVDLIFSPPPLPPPHSLPAPASPCTSLCPTLWTRPCCARPRRQR